MPIFRWFYSLIRPRQQVKAFSYLPERHPDQLDDHFVIVRASGVRFVKLLDKVSGPSYNDADFEYIESVQSRLERAHQGTIQHHTMLRLEMVNIDAGKCIASVRTPSDGCRMLYNCVRALSAKNVVEFGTGFGISAMYLASACRYTGGHVRTVEPELWRAEIAKSELQKRWEGLVTVYHGKAEEVFPRLGLQVDFGYIDAWHSYEVTLDHFELIWALCSPGAVIALDDMAGFSAEMDQLWKDLTSRSDVQNAALWNDRIGLIMV